MPMVRLIAASALTCNLCIIAAAAGQERHRTLGVQIALERAGFSPGLIDGQSGPKTELAIRQFQQARRLPATGRIDAATTAALKLPEKPTITYAITPGDTALVTRPPTGWEAKSKARCLGYHTLAEAVAERFHCSQALLRRLNPGKDLARLTAGQTLTVPAIDAPERPRAHRIEIDLPSKTIRALDAGGAVVGFFHCSVAAKSEKRPSGAAKVQVIANDPTYVFDPKMWPEVKNVNRKLVIPPGPRNPVGSCWIGLSLPGYGIHGSPNPELIGKTGSHGCFRLTNWDALRLARMVRPGTTVQFITQAAVASR